MTLPQPYPPGQEIATIDNADAAHAGNVRGDRVKAPGSEVGRVWPQGPPGLPGQPPAASFTCTPPAPKTNADVTFNGSGSQPGYLGWPITRYDWVTDNQNLQDAGPVVAGKAPNRSGSYTVTLTVTAADGQRDSASQVFTLS